MGKSTSIEWCDHSWSPWHGCAIPKLPDGEPSPECIRCYAMVSAKRNPAVLGVWGLNGTRVLKSDAGWKDPLKWDAEARSAGVRRRVFCASISDVFEVWPGRLVDSKGNDAGTMDRARARLFNMIMNTPNLNWLMLTKRPENILPALRAARDAITDTTIEPYWHAKVWIDYWLAGKPPHNVWIGTTAGTQRSADLRIPQLLGVPADVRFLSMEPLLESVDLSPWIGNMFDPSRFWVIAGGESGHGARPMHVDWARSIRDQCLAADVPFFMKQMAMKAEIPADLYIREFPS